MRFELSELEQFELNNCDQDIAKKFIKFGGGYTNKLPTLIQLSRNIAKLNNNLKLLFNQCQNPEK